MNSYAVIMAGGTGTRLWPLSRREQPKQTHALIGEHSMFQETVHRITPMFSHDHIYVVAGGKQAATLSQQVPEIPAENYIVEPEGRGTAPCIGLATVYLQKHDPDAVTVILTADHHIGDPEEFRETLKAGIKTAEEGYLATIGIEPTTPSTAYGYIKQGEKILEVDDRSVYRVERFTEKPDRETAEQMCGEGVYSWNSGMFIWRAEAILAEYSRQMPTLHRGLTKIQEAIGTTGYDQALAKHWPGVPRQTIDYGVMEGAENVAVIPASFGWSDVGSWSSLHALLPKDDKGNAVKGSHLGIDTGGSLILGGERLIATIGLQDVVIVDTGDALLVCAKGQDQRVRDIVKRLEAEGGRYV
ncbi:mannose-1-phosphate guanylyltransferase [Candidatus Bathyarchaeota archaeon]|nr:mannose-1-phosphate guanylyltransferase [Candidatus Bathyarchaeota archaeon]